MKYHTSIPLFIIFCGLLPATLQCSIKKSSTIADITTTHDDEDDNFEYQSKKFNNAKQLELLEQHGLINSSKDLSDATTAQEAYEIFKRPYIQKKSNNLPIMQYAVLNNLPHIALLLIDAGYSIDRIDEISLKAQLKMLDQKQSTSKN